MIILDESTSAVDAAGEIVCVSVSVVQAAKASYCGILLVSHRHSIVEQFADRVLVMAGMIVADGTHAQLVATANTAYEQFVNAGKE